MKAKPRFRKTKAVDPEYTIRLLSQKLNDEAVLVVDVDQNQLWAARNLKEQGW